MTVSCMWLSIAVPTASTLRCQSQTLCLWRSWRWTWSSTKACGHSSRSSTQVCRSCPRKTGSPSGNWNHLNLVSYSAWHISLSGNHQHSLSQMACTSPSAMSTLGGKDSICLLFRPLFTLGVRDCVPVLPVTVRSWCQRLHTCPSCDCPQLVSETAYLSFLWLSAVGVRDCIPVLPVTVRSWCQRLHPCPSCDCPQLVSEILNPLQISVHTPCQRLHTSPSCNCPQSVSEILNPLQISVHTPCQRLHTSPSCNCPQSVSEILSPLQISVHTQCQRLHTSPSCNCPQCQDCLPFVVQLFVLSVQDAYLSFQ